MMSGAELSKFLTTGAVAGALGWGGKWLQSWLDSSAKRRDALEDQVLTHVGKSAPKYDLMSNYAYLLARSLVSYLDAELQVQLTADAPQARQNLSARQEDCARISVFLAAKLYGAMMNLFWVEGGKYYLPDAWAGQTMMDLHIELVNRLHFAPEKLSPFVKDGVWVHDFIKLVEAAKEKKDDPDSVNLIGEIARFRDWLRTNDRETRELARYSLAYSELFDQQMRSLWRRKPISPFSRPDPNRGIDLDNQAFPRMDKMREVLESATAQRMRDRGLWTDSVDSQNMNFHELFGTGWALYESGQYEPAIGKYELALRENQGSAECHNNIGHAYLKLQKYPQAESMYRQAIEEAGEANPDRAALFELNFGVMYGQWSRDETQPREDRAEARSVAIGHFGEAVRLAPLNAFYWNELGNEHCQRQEWTEAVRAYTAAVERLPTEPVIQSNLAWAYGQLKDGQQQAERHYAEAVAWLPPPKKGEEGQRPQRATYLAGRASALKNLDRVADAQALWREALACDPGNAEHAWSLANSYQAIKQPVSKEDLQLVLAVLRTRGTAVDHCRASILYYRRADYMGALEEANVAVRLDPKDAENHHQLGVTYRRLEFSDVALRCYQTATELAPDNLNYKRSLAFAHHALRQYEDALPLLNVLLKKEPKDADCVIAAAECIAYGPRKDLKEALRLCTERIAVKPEDWRLYRTAGFFERVRGEHAAALKLLERALEQCPLPNEKTVLLTTMREECDRELVARPQDPAVHYLSGRIYDLTGDYTDSVKAFETAIPLYQDQRWQALATNALARVQFRLRNFQEARIALEKVREATGFFSKAEVAGMLNHLGTTLERLSQSDEALQCYAQAAELSPETLAFHYDLAASFYWHGEFAKALAEFEQCCRLDSPFLDAPFQMGNCYYRLGRKDLAKGRWEAAAVKDSTLAGAIANLGVLQFETDRLGASQRWKQAVKLNSELQPPVEMLKAMDRGETPILKICEAPTKA